MYPHYITIRKNQCCGPTDLWNYFIEPTHPLNALPNSAVPERVRTRHEKINQYLAFAGSVDNENFRFISGTAR
jgi:hypothetical protein